MVFVYPVVFTRVPEGLTAYVPDLDISAGGADLADAIESARDAISVWCVGRQENGCTVPSPSDLSAVKHKANQILTLVDADVDAYRRSTDNRAVKKTLTLPSWLNEQAEKAGINFSQLLQKALKEELRITR